MIGVDGEAPHFDAEILLFEESIDVDGLELSSRRATSDAFQCPQVESFAIAAVNAAMVSSDGVPKSTRPTPVGRGSRGARRLVPTTGGESDHQHWNNDKSSGADRHERNPCIGLPDAASEQSGYRAPPYPPAPKDEPAAIRKNPEGALPKRCPLGVVSRPFAVRSCDRSSPGARSVLTVAPIPFGAPRCPDRGDLQKPVDRSRRFPRGGSPSDLPPGENRSPCPSASFRFRKTPSVWPKPHRRGVV